MADSDLASCGSNVCRLASGEGTRNEPHKSCESAVKTAMTTYQSEEEFSPTEPIVGRVANGVANRVDRLKAIGNGQVPQCAAMAFSILSEGLI
jgi:hypothetical protein